MADDDLPDTFNCPICFLKYTENDQRPLMICTNGHTICSSCHADIISTLGQRCPIGRDCPLLNPPVVNRGLLSATEEFSSHRNSFSQERDPQPQRPAPPVSVFQSFTVDSIPSNSNFVSTAVAAVGDSGSRGSVPQSAPRGYNRSSVVEGPRGERYVGETRDGVPHGCGVKTFPDGTRYEGTFVEGRREGHGIQTCRDGEHYEGGFRNDVRHGRGVGTLGNGTRLEGEWKDGKRHGFAIIDFIDGSRFVGQYVDDKKNGRGVYTWKNGNRFEGEYANGMRNGQGVFTYPSGEKYDGGYLDDKRHGHAMYTYTTGEKYEGNFVNGQMHDKSARYHHRNGQIQAVEYQNGHFVRWLFFHRV